MTNGQFDKMVVELLDPVIDLADGFNYVTVRRFVNQMASQAASGDKAAKDIMNVVARFSRLVTIILREAQ